MQPATDKERFPTRKHPRLKGFDYASENYYFITICTWNKDCIFGEPMALSPWGMTAQKALLEIEQHFPNIRVDQYAVMPNHVHMILAAESAGTSIPQVIGQYKAAVTRRLRRSGVSRKIWQTSFHDHVIRNLEDYQRIWSYIESNPRNWEKDCFFETV